MMGGMGNDDTALVSPAAELSMPLLENPDDRFSPTNGDGAARAGVAQQLGLGRELQGGAPHAPAAAAPPATTATALVPAPAPAAPAAETAMEEAVEGRGGDMWTAEEDRTIDEGVRLEGSAGARSPRSCPAARRAAAATGGCARRSATSRPTAAPSAAPSPFCRAPRRGPHLEAPQVERRDHRRRGGPADVGFRGELPSELVV